MYVLLSDNLPGFLTAAVSMVLLSMSPPESDERIFRVGVCLRNLFLGTSVLLTSLSKSLSELIAEAVNTDDDDDDDFCRLCLTLLLTLFFVGNLFLLAPSTSCSFITLESRDLPFPCTFLLDLPDDSPSFDVFLLETYSREGKSRNYCHMEEIFNKNVTVKLSLCIFLYQILHFCRGT